MTQRIRHFSAPNGALAYGVAAAVALVATVAWTTTLLKLDVEKMSREAALVVVGHVAWDYSTRPDPKGPIYSYTGIEVSQCVAGECAETVTLKHRGGTVGKLTLFIPGMPRFQPGDKVLLFLRPDPEGEAGMYAVFGMCQGHFRIVEDPESGASMAVQQLGAITLAAPGPGGQIVPVSAVAPVEMELSQLVARIQHARAVGAAGGTE